MSRSQSVSTVAWLLAACLLTAGATARAQRFSRAERAERAERSSQQITLPPPDPSTLLPLTPTYLRRAAEQPPAPPAPPIAVSPETEKAKRSVPANVVALREPVRQILTQQQSQPFNTRDNFPGEIMDFCLAFGCGTEVSLEGVGGQRINGITCLCWNYPCAGFEMLRMGQGHIVARIGYGCQEYPGELIAALAISGVPATYPIRVRSDVRTVADLVAGEQLSCRAHTNMSLKLIGLTYYVEAPSWKNDLGEEWSLERVIQQEIAQPVVSAPDGGLNRLMGLAYVVRHRVKHELPIEGQYQRAQKYIDDFYDFALRLQNSDGTWGPYLLAARSASSDATTQLWATGRVLEWLAMSLPDERLTDPRVILALEQVVRLLGSQRYQQNVPSLSTQEIGAFGHALHALAVYDERVLKPIDAAEKAAAEKAAAEKAAAEKAAAEKAAAEKAAAEKAAAEKAAAEKPSADKPAAEKPVSDKPAAQ